MNTNIFRFIFGSILFSGALFAFSGEALAAPTLLPGSVRNITETDATLVGYVVNRNATSVVWFEWSGPSAYFSSVSGAPTTVATQSIYGERSFEWHLHDLVPGATYTFRTVAREGNVIVYSPITTFRTLIPDIYRTQPVSYQTSPLPSGSYTAPTQTTQTVVTPAPVTQTQTQAPSQINKSGSTGTVVAKETSSSVTSDGFQNGNIAGVAGVSGSVFPTTLLGWLLLLVAILVAILVSILIFEVGEKRKKALAGKKHKETSDDDEMEDWMKGETIEPER